MRYRLRTLLILLGLGPVALWLTWTPPPPPVPIETMRPGATAKVDVIQLHECCDSKLPQTFNQVIFWSRYPDGELHVRAWRMIGSSSTQNFHLHEGGKSGCECSWTEGKFQRRVHAPTLLKTRSSADPEMEDRKNLPKPKRDPLWLGTS